MKIKIITHERVVADEEVDEIYVKTIDGEIGILKGHVPVMCVLDICLTRTKSNGICKVYTTMGGILQFNDEVCTILTDTAEAGNEIDELRAKESLERAERRLKEARARVDIQRAEAAIARAKARLKASLNETD